MLKSFLKKNLVYSLLIIAGILIVGFAFSELTGNLLIALSVLGGIILFIGFWKSIKNDELMVHYLKID